MAHLSDRSAHGRENPFSRVTFKINFYICKRAISVSNAKLLLETGKTSKIKGFTSKKNTPFDAQLKLDEEKKVVFDF